MDKRILANLMQFSYKFLEYHDEKKKGDLSSDQEKLLISIIVLFSAYLKSGHTSLKFFGESLSVLYSEWHRVMADRYDNEDLYVNGELFDFIESIIKKIKEDPEEKEHIAPSLEEIASFPGMAPFLIF